MKSACICLFALMVLSFSCTKKADEIDETNTAGLKLHRVLSEGRLVQEYEYNQDGMVIRQTFYGHGNNKSGETIYFYDANKKLVRTETFSDVSSSTAVQQLSYGYAEYDYDSDGRISRTRTFSKFGAAFEQTSIIVPTYDGQGRVISTLQSSVDNKPANLFKYEYDQRGNIISQESYRYEGSVLTLGFRTTYEHDDKSNPYLNLLVLPFSVNKNNITKHTTTNYNLTPGTPAVSTMETFYKRYNSAGLPVEVIEKGAGVFLYEYK